MAVLTFSSSGAYEVAEVGDVKSVSMSNQIFVAGFPLPKSAVPSSAMSCLVDNHPLRSDFMSVGESERP